MARNVEIKARAPQATAIAAIARTLSAQPSTTIDQTDVFFPTDRGRLKLRILSPDHGELIFYDRPDQAGPRTSTYSVSTTDQPAALRAVLAAAYGEDAIVRKVRELFWVGRTRIHIDRVDRLGDFVELEVALDDGEDPAAGIAEAHALIETLGIQQSDLVKSAYVDLLRMQDLSA